MAHALHYKIMSSYFTVDRKAISLNSHTVKNISAKILGKESFQPPRTRRCWIRSIGKYYSLHQQKSFKNMLDKYLSVMTDAYLILTYD